MGQEKGRGLVCVYESQKKINVVMTVTTKFNVASDDLYPISILAGNVPLLTGFHHIYSQIRHFCQMTTSSNN